MFKRNYYIITFLSFIFLGCNDDVKTMFSEVNISVPKNTIVEVNIPIASGNKAVANHINSEIQKTVIASLQIGESDTIPSKTIEESIVAFNNEYKAFQKDFPEIEQLWEAQVDGDMMFQSLEIISIAITSYVNTGGAQGVLNISLINFNAETGQRIENIKLINDLEGFKPIAKRYFENATKNNDAFLETESFELPANMGYSEDGIVLLYNTYEMMPSSEIVQFTIPFEEAASFLVFNSL